MAVRHRGERLRLSPTSPLVATLVVYDVDTLTRHQQRALNHWIAWNGGTQVVSTATKSLWPLLQAGAFDEALYYRLNVVMIDPTSPVAR
jgi:predicted naringenin-chalcone synthase